MALAVGGAGLTTLGQEAAAYALSNLNSDENRLAMRKACAIAALVALGAVGTEIAKQRAAVALGAVGTEIAKQRAVVALRNLSADAESQAAVREAQQALASRVREWQTEATL